MKKFTFLIIFLVLVTISLSLIRTYVANNIATSGVVLADLEQKTQELETENSILSEKFYNESSLTNIASKAADLGFVEEKESIVISSGQSVAFKQ